MTAPKFQDESIWHMRRCDWCLGEVRSDQVIYVGEKEYCSEDCRKKGQANPEGRE